MSDLVVMEVVGSELDAVMVCSILRDAGVPCMHRVTNVGSGAMDGLTIGGPREIVVHPEQLELARRVIGEQRGGPGPSPGRRSEAVVSPPLAQPIAPRSVEAPDERVVGAAI